MTNLDVTLRELRARRDQVDCAIAQLSKLLDSPIHDEADRLVRRGRKRGRKGMSPEQRQEVSTRMHAYWESRRAEKAAAATV